MNLEFLSKLLSISFYLFLRFLKDFESATNFAHQSSGRFMYTRTCVDRSEASKRRTKTEKKTLSPHWNQSFVYSPIRRGDLGSMSLELSLWDLDRSVETNNHFIGEVIMRAHTHRDTREHSCSACVCVFLYGGRFHVCVCAQGWDRKPIW